MPVGKAGADKVRVSPKTVEDVGLSLLQHVGVPRDTAEKVLASVVRSERAGHSSHGLLRLAHYVLAIEQGIIDPIARPTVELIDENRATVDGKWGLGVLAAETIRDTLSGLLVHAALAAVSVRHAGHLGRLGDIVEPLARNGHVSIGFVNAHGGYQLMAPWGGTEPRLATNPIVFGFPSSDQPVVIDLTTSVKAEGFVHLHALEGAPLDEGVLVDADWKPVTEPGKLYQKPMQAFLAPLGGPVGYKGFALALAVEIMAGVLTGAGFARAGAEGRGNAALFIAMRTDAFGCMSDAVRRHVSELVGYVQSTPTATGYPAIRVPASSDVSGNDEIEIPTRVWQAIERLARRHRAADA